MKTFPERNQPSRKTAKDRIAFSIASLTLTRPSSGGIYHI